MKKNSLIYVAGHTGLLGRGLVALLRTQGYRNLILNPRKKMDLCDQDKVRRFFLREKPEFVFYAAGKVGGIRANIAYPAQFIYENIMMETNIIHSAYLSGVKKLLFLGSACSYPKNCAQPMKEKDLLTGILEPTNEPYAIAKIAGIKMCQAYHQQYRMYFIPCIATNAYGPGDHFHSQDSHVIPALITKIHQAKTKGSVGVSFWGTGKPVREFIYIDDLADACLFLMQNGKSSEIVNVGVGKGITIRELAQVVKEVVGFKGEIIFDTSKPDGAVRKVLDVSKIKKMGWQAKTNIKDGIKQTYQWYLKI